MKSSTGLGPCFFSPLLERGLWPQAKKATPKAAGFNLREQYPRLGFSDEASCSNRPGIFRTRNQSHHQTHQDKRRTGRSAAIRFREIDFPLAFNISRSFAQWRQMIQPSFHVDNPYTRSLDAQSKQMNRPDTLTAKSTTDHATIFTSFSLFHNGYALRLQTAEPVFGLIKRSSASVNSATEHRKGQHGCSEANTEPGY